MTGFRPSLSDAIPHTVAVSIWGIKKAEAMIQEDQSLAMTAYILEAMNLLISPAQKPICCSSTVRKSRTMK